MEAWGRGRVGGDPVRGAEPVGEGQNAAWPVTLGALESCLCLSGTRGLGASLFPEQEVCSSTICLCLITVVEGPDKTVLQVLLGQL